MNAPDLKALRVNPDWAKLPLFDRKGWRRLAFGEFGECVNERVEPSEAADEIYVGLDDLEPGNLHIRKWGKGSDVIGTKLRFRKGDIIFGRRRAYQRKLAVADFDGICSAHAVVVRARPEVVLPEFLPFLMMSDRFMKRAVEISVGSLSPTINWKTLKLEDFDLPPLEQQRRIAEMLSTGDDAQERARGAWDASLILMDAKLQEFLYETSAWPMHDCRDLLDDGPRNGYSPPANSEGMGLPTLSIGAVRDGKVNVEGNLKYANVNMAEVEKFQLRKNDILVVRGNGNRQLCGRAGLVDEVPDGCFYPDLLIRLRFNPKVMLQQFGVLQWNESKTYSRLIAKAKSTNGIWKINGKDIQSHSLLVPPIGAQRAFLTDMDSHMRITDILRQDIDACARLQVGLLNTVFAE